MKFSIRFDRDYNFYLNHIKVWDFCGTLNPKFTAVSSDKGLTAKECFYYIESNGINKPCNEPELLNKLLLTKASINFQIKEWAQGRSDGTLALPELSKRLTRLNYPKNTISDNDCQVLEWISGEPVYSKDIETLYCLPEWVVTAVENQKVKYL